MARSCWLDLIYLSSCDCLFCCFDVPLFALSPSLLSFANFKRTDVNDPALRFLSFRTSFLPLVATMYADFGTYGGFPLTRNSHVRTRVNKTEVMYVRPTINVCNVWPSRHCLYFVYAHKSYVRTLVIITRQWKSAFNASTVLNESPIL